MQAGEWNFTPLGYQVIERTRNSIANDQRGNNSKNIQSIVMVLKHDTLSICALEVYEVQPNSFNSVQLTVQTKNCI